MSPAEFLNEDVPVGENLANMARMIATNLVILDTLIFTVVLLVEMCD
jgi:hypothetical protein